MKVKDFNKDIPDISPDILTAAAQGKLVVFIGAGVSKIIGCPLWQEFAAKMLKDLHDKNCINYYEYNSLERINDSRKLLSICKKIYEENNVEPFDFESIFKGEPDLLKNFGKIYEDLYSFNAIYLTTNYDIFLDQVLINLLKENSYNEDPGNLIYKENISKIKIINEKSGLLTSNLAYKNILHLHGNIEKPKEMIITIIDYMKHYAKESEASCLLEKVFQEYTVLFVGYGLEEYEILEFIISKTQQAKREVKHFMLYPIFSSEKNLIKFQKKYYADLGVQLIPYPIDIKGHNQLVLIINNWARQISPLSRSQNFLERIKLIDEVM